MNFFDTERQSFEFWRAKWRSPQRGALGSLIAHWALDPSDPALVSLPTGAGRTGVALAIPFLTPEPPKRILVLVPSKATRDQIAEQFGSMKLLRNIGALTRWREPSTMKVSKIEGVSTVWSTIDDADVVVAIPQSISPRSETSVSVPPENYFDLVIVDEAHHLPAATWQGVVEHLKFKNAVYLTATPFRLDRKRVPGSRTFYYPLRQAISESFYKPIRPLILPPPTSHDVSVRDNAIAEAVMNLTRASEHSTTRFANP